MVGYKKFRVASLNFVHNPLMYEERVDLLVEELVRLNPDVLLLQEAIVEKLDFLKERFLEAGLVFAHRGNDATANSRKIVSTNSIFVKPDWSFQPYSQVAVETGVLTMPVAKGVIGGVNIYVISAHLNHGGRSERERLQQVFEMNFFVEKIKRDDPRSIVVFGGDLNAPPTSDTIRYLKGEHTFLNTSTLWVDAFSKAQDPNDPDCWVTSAGSDYWGSVTAQEVGTLHPELTPPRRIDYIFVHGWVYGRPGCPLWFSTWAKTDKFPYISDHYGVAADLLLPG